MKKLSLLYAFLFVAAFVSCKDEDEDPTFKKSDFLGKWEETASTPPDDESETCTTSKEEIEITDDDIKVTSTCDGFSGSIDYPYTFDNKRTLTVTITILTETITMKTKILELSGTTMKVENYYNGTKAETVTYKKV